MNATSTKNRKRTDIHRPSAIDPTEYNYVGVEYLKIEGLEDVHTLAHYREVIKNHKAMTGGEMSTHDHGGNCHVCGAHCIYTALFYHLETNTYIRTGFDCADKLDMGNAIDFRSIKKHVKDAREAKAGKKKAEAILSDAGLSRAYWLTYTATTEELVELGALIPREYDGETRHLHTNELSTLTDIVGRLAKYGSISEKAENYLRVLVGRIDRHKEILAERKAEKAAAADCPEGRMFIEGTVLKTEERDTMYGLCMKMTIKHDSGWIVWGTMPSDMNASRGDRVKFKGTVTVSDRDPKFGFFKRPSNGEILSENSEN